MHIWDLEVWASRLPGLELVEDARCPCACYQAFAPGRGRISYAPGCREEDFLHEIGHYAHWHGLAAHLRLAALLSGEPRLFRLARVVRWREEAEASAFARDWLEGG